MIQVVAPVGALLASVALLLMGNGLQGTLLPIRAEIETFGPVAIGVMGSAYFLGFALGCLYGPVVVGRVGHIRTFTAATALASTVALAHAMITEPWAWWPFRALTGFAFAILYMVIESWLNERASNETRGTVMSIYTVINLTVIMAGQMLLTVYDPASFAPFALASILVSLAALPVALTTALAPAPLRSTKIRLMRLYRISPVGFMGAFAVGLGNGAFWSLAPVFATGSGLTVNGVATFMSLVVLGGAIGQYPLGKLSDRTDRRRVILGATIGVCATAALLPVVAGLFAPGLYVGAFLFGLTAMPVYSLSVAHMNDFVEPDGFVEASSGMLMVFAIGAIAGPMIASWATGIADADLLFPYIAVVYLGFTGFVVVRMRARAAPAPEDRPDFVATPGTSPALGALDPRSDAEPHATDVAAATHGESVAAARDDGDPTAGNATDRGMVSRPPPEQS
ncbi:MAG: MFS transporter [Thalassobaculum sp.]|uniref:MFS transporter n=1 Tax=Thalassobaculum sp. TaxID=2022740 RepID=UPI0032EC6E80